MAFLFNRNFWERKKQKKCQIWIRMFKKEEKIESEMNWNSIGNDKKNNELGVTISNVEK